MNNPECEYYATHFSEEHDQPFIIAEFGAGNPVLAINVATHGNEHEPVYAVETLLKGSLSEEELNGTLRFVFSNPPAYRENKRYLVDDLNRVYPGDINLPGERSLAPKVLNLISDATYVVDLHTSPIGVPMCIVGARNEARLSLAEIAGVPNIVLFEAQKACAMVDFSTCGVGIEIGGHTDLNASTLGVTIMERYINVLLKQQSVLPLEHPPTYYEVLRPIRLPEAEDLSLISFQDFEPIDDASTLFPILCGVREHTDIFCYLTKKISRKDFLRKESSYA